MTSSSETAAIETLLEDGTSVPDLSTFDIVYDTESLIEKAQLYQLLGHEASIAFGVNLGQLETLHGALQGEFNSPSIQALLVAVAQWPSVTNFDQFTEYCNDAIARWIQAVADGLSIMHVVEILSCVTVEQIHHPEAWRMFITDIVSETVLSHQQQQVHYLLHHDVVTKLPNTNLMLKDIDTLLENNTATLTLFSMRFLIERGSVNVSPIIPNTLNRYVLDMVNKVMPDAQIYQNGDLLFSALITQPVNEIALTITAAKLQNAFEQVIDIEQQAFIVSPVMCAVCNLTPDQSASTYYNQSRTALRYAIDKGHSFVVHTPEIDAAEAHQKKVDLEVTAAFNNEELELYLQPIVGLPKEKVVGAEVLLRWPNATTPGIYPNIVVEIINKVGLGKQFTRWLIHSVCRLSSELKNQHGLPVYLTLNLRAEDLYDTELPHLLLKSTELWQVSHQDIVLEITENGILEENETSLSVISQMTKNGFKLALDDFGTGYSSMERLRTLPISLIKIDQSFVRQINTKISDLAMVKSMSMLAESLGKEVLVEGVEDQACLDIIKTLGIDKVQGYHYAKPMPFNEFVTWAKNNLAN